eukprot:TRINITY_DN51028_c0_g1_i1.p1 TRINITY_DN51028_c0_g1~~TRINITY_DN51028_c0_g1_i1.p1  ORF type:complete len:426 (+),score=121.89 TRINITY_DN51028_c0_g1_i1:74-1351(+)
MAAPGPEQPAPKLRSLPAKGPQLRGVVEKPPSLGVVIDAILQYDLESLREALAAEGASVVDPDGIPALHFCVAQGWAEGMAELLGHEADALQMAPDMRYRIAGAPVYQTGGTAAHRAAEAGDAQLLRLLAAACPDVLQHPDLDGHTPAEVAQLFCSRSCLAELGVAQWDAEQLSQRRARWIPAQRKRIDAAAGEAERRRVAAIQDKYLRKHPELFRADPGDDALLLAPGLSAQGAAATAAVVCDGAWTLPALSARGCEMLLAEAGAYRDSMPGEQRRANSMHRRSVAVTDMGLAPLLWRWVREVITPLSRELFADPSDPARGPFSSLHAFVVHYRVGEDTELAEHADDSDLTVNICLGKAGFEGAGLYFRPSASGEPLRHAHSVGHAVVHRGSLRHGVEPLSRGERANLVIWCRHRPPRPGLSVS